MDPDIHVLSSNFAGSLNPPGSGVSSGMPIGSKKFFFVCNGLRVKLWTGPISLNPLGAPAALMQYPALFWRRYFEYFFQSFFGLPDQCVPELFGGATSKLDQSLTQPKTWRPLYKEGSLTRGGRHLEPESGFSVLCPFRQEFLHGPTL